MPRVIHRSCPHCGRQVCWPETPTYPFCSERCRLIDLGMWASEQYRLPGEPLTDDALWQQPTTEGEETTENGPVA